jgi:hypothetical protein
MAFLNLNNTAIGNSLMQLLIADDIQPGDSPSYQLCKTIYSYHPLGKKLCDGPIVLALSQEREISVPTGPDRVRQAFVDQWKKDSCDRLITNVGSTSRRYGIAALAILVARGGVQIPTDEPIPYDKLHELEVSFSVLDPLNTAGSLVGDLNPNSMGFMKNAAIAVSGKRYHRSRAVVKMNEEPIYLEYTGSAFGYVGRSVYQRSLYPLKSFVKTMITDEMVATKAGVIVAKMKPAGSIVSNLMQTMFGQKRDIVKEAATWNVISITTEEEIAAIDLQNVNTAMEVSRRNIINNIALADGQPAILLNSDKYAEGFGEGTEDAAAVATYIKGVRDELGIVYDWLDPIVMHRAWNPNFYRTIQEELPDEWGRVGYEAAFQEWRNSFRAIWPSLIQEPDSDKVEVADKKLKALIALLQVLIPELDPANKGVVIQWVQDNFNELEDLFTVPLDLDMEGLLEWAEEQSARMEEMGAGEDGGGDKEPPEPKPFAATDSQRRVRLRSVK